MKVNEIIYDIKGISDNSQLVKAGDLFVLIPSFSLAHGRLVQGGGNIDISVEEIDRYKQYVQEAFSKGATRAMLDRSLEKSINFPLIAKDRLIFVDDIVNVVSEACKAFYHDIPKHILGVTGTNGKTSTVEFIRQLFEMHGVQCATIGTMGVRVGGKEIDFSGYGYSGRTTTSLVSNYKILSALKRDFGINFVAMELSSHGLAQGRVMGLGFDNIGFTSFSQDHLDYHQTMQSYLESKLKIFELSDKFIINKHIKALSEIKNRAPMSSKLILYDKNNSNKVVPHHLVGGFQILNAICAAIQVAESLKIPQSEVIAKLKDIKPVKGRMELANKFRNTLFIIDYAHTPDGLENALKALRPYCRNGGKLAVVFGAGGERDQGKRSLMGEVAGMLADIIVVTDDNPRKEAPDIIRNEIISGIKNKNVNMDNVESEADRQRAIEKALRLLDTDNSALINVILVAGKGHEEEQIYADKVVKYSDFYAVKRVIAKLSSIWDVNEIIGILNPISMNSVGRDRLAAKAISHVTIDSRDVKVGSLFIAINGNNNDGHSYINEAFDKGASFAIIDNPGYAHISGTILVRDTFDALRRIALEARNRLNGQAKVVGITGSFGKTSTKEMLSLVGEDLYGKYKVYKNQGSFNNHYGVPLTLANMPKDISLAVIEMGMNHAGEIKEHVQMVKPDIALITNIGAAHMANFNSLNDVAFAKAEIFEVGSPIVVLNKDDAKYALLKMKAMQHRVDRIISFSSVSPCEADICARDIVIDHTGTSAKIIGAVPLKMNIIGVQWLQNALGVLGVVKALRLSIKKACASLEKFKPVAGRGKIIKHKKITIVDESYNAQPLAMITAIKNMSYYKSRRNVAVLGDMYDLGGMTLKAHLDLASHIINSDIHVLYLCGEYMYELYKKLQNSSHRVKLYYAKTPTEVFNLLKNDIIPDDLYMIKGSRGNGDKPRMYEVVEKLLKT